MKARSHKIYKDLMNSPQIEDRYAEVECAWLEVCHDAIALQEELDRKEVKKQQKTKRFITL